MTDKAQSRLVPGQSILAMDSTGAIGGAPPRLSFVKTFIQFALIGFLGSLFGSLLAEQIAQELTRRRLRAEKDYQLLLEEQFAWASGSGQVRSSGNLISWQNFSTGNAPANLVFGREDGETRVISEENASSFLGPFAYAPIDDEIEDDEERSAIAEAQEDIARGRTRSWTGQPIDGDTKSTHPLEP